MLYSLTVEYQFRLLVSKVWHCFYLQKLNVVLKQTRIQEPDHHSKCAELLLIVFTVSYL